MAAFAIPNGTVTALAVISLSLLCRIQGYMAWETGAFLIVLSLGVLSFRLIPRFLHAVDSGQQRRVQGFYFAFCVMLVAALSQLPFVRSLFQLDTLQLLPFLDTLLIIFIAGWCQLLLVRRHTQTIIEL